MRHPSGGIEIMFIQQEFKFKEKEVCRVLAPVIKESKSEIKNA